MLDVRSCTWGLLGLVVAAGCSSNGGSARDSGSTGDSGSAPDRSGVDGSAAPDSADRDAGPDTAGDGGGTVPAGASSFARIEAALAAGRIDLDTAMTYKVYASFSDARLPAAYRGADEGIFDTAVLAELNAGFDKLAAATQDQLGPYLLRPSNIGSWAQPASARVVSPRASGSVVAHARRGCLGDASEWEAITATNSKVWYKASVPGDKTQAQELSNALENEIWPSLVTGIGFPKPLDDKKLLGCDGGDGKLDVYVVSALAQQGLTVPESVSNLKQSPVYILLRSGLPDPKAALAHEVMHAIQYAYAMAAGQESYGWLRDAMANWAIDHVYPSSQYEQRWADCFTSSPQLPLEDRSEGHCKTVGSGVKRDYGAYLLFQYLEKTQSPQRVKAVLDATQSQASAMDALDTGLPGGVAGEWPKFAKLLWNQNPVDVNSFKTWDGLSKTPDPVALETVTLAGDGFNRYDFTEKLEPMSIQYYHFQFNEETLRSVAFLNHPLALPSSVIKVQAFVLMEGSIWEYQDWTTDVAANRSLIKFCRDAVKERLAQLVVVVSSADFRGAVPPQREPRLGVNNMGCWGWQGTTSYKAMGQQPGAGMVSVNSTTVGVKFRRVPDLLGLGTTHVRYEVTDGTLGGSFEGIETVTGCSTRGNYAGVSVAAMPVMTELETNSFLVGGAELFADGWGPRQYRGSGTAQGQISATYSCPNPPFSMTVPYPVPGTWLTFDDTQKPFFGKSDGTLDGVWTNSDGSESCNWNFRPIRE